MRALRRALLGICLPLGVAAAEPVRIETPQTQRPLVVDGRIGSGEWSDATRVRGFETADGETLSGEILVAASATKLRLAFRVPASAQSLLTRARANQRSDTLAPLDDSISLWIRAARGASASRGLQLVFNAEGAMWAAQHELRDGQWRSRVDAAAPAVVASRVEGGFWSAEVELRAGRLVRDAADAGEWELRALRQERLPSRQAGWPAAPVAGGSPFAAAAEWKVRRDALKVALADDAVVLETSAAADLSLRVRAGGQPGCAAIEGQRLTLAAGAPRRLALSAACAASGGQLRLLSEQGAALRASLPLRAGASTADASSALAEVRNLRFQFGYYPYRSEARVRLDASAARPALPAETSVRIEVRRESGSELLVDEMIPLGKAGVSERRLTLPKLADGGYVARLRLRSGGSEQVLEQRFEHRHFGWEHNQLGITDTPIPPFTALVARGRELRSLLRVHRLADTGLLEQVEAAGEALLAAPMRLEATIGGRARALVEPAGPSWTRREATRAEYEAKPRVGGLRTRLAGRFEMDGMLRIALSLPAQPAVTLDALELVIPLRADRARLINAVTDRTRYHLSGVLPRGQGALWKSSDAQRTELRGDFVPYVWLGDEARGLSWFANGTEDWVLAPGAPAQRILRRGDVIELRVQLIARRTRLERAREIVFGIQATPTKGMVIGAQGGKASAAEWRGWQPGCGQPPPVRSLCIFPTTSEWGGATVYGDFYPAEGNEDIVEALAAARRTGFYDRGSVRRFLRRRKQKHPRPGAMERSLAHGFHIAASQPDALIAYLTAHHIADTPEFEVYQDEWSAEPFADRDRPDPDLETLHKTFPTRSWQDFALWHLKRLLDAGVADGYFFDNTFLRAIFDDYSGAAYRNDAGELRPAVDLFELREFLQRAQVMAYRARGRWFNVSHMTNTPIAPIHSWSAAMLDGEMRFGKKPLQQRFDRSWLRAGALGTQFGSMPIFMPGIINLPKGPERTRAEESTVAAAAVHEIRSWGSANQAIKTLWDPLYAFGYGAPGTRVHRYWDEAVPFEVRGVDAEALVVVRGKEAMALVVSFGAGGVAELRLDGLALGLAKDGRCRGGASRRKPRTTGAFRCSFELPRYGWRRMRWELL